LRRPVGDALIHYQFRMSTWIITQASTVVTWLDLGLIINYLKCVRLLTNIMSHF
jgi:hypothetical protein